jgi:hypothetical protein
MDLKKILKKHIKNNNWKNVSELLHFYNYSIHIDRDVGLCKLLNVTHDIVLCNKIEMSVIKFTIRYCDTSNICISKANSIYENKLNSLIKNLDPNSSVGNKKLLKRIKRGKINPSDLAFLSPKELFPSNWKIESIRLKLTLENNNFNL